MEVFIIFMVLDFIQTMIIPILILITIIPCQQGKFPHLKNIYLVIIQFRLALVVIY